MEQKRRHRNRTNINILNWFLTEKQSQFNERKTEFVTNNTRAIGQKKKKESHYKPHALYKITTKWSTDINPKSEIKHFRKSRKNLRSVIRQ